MRIAECTAFVCHSILSRKDARNASRWQIKGQGAYFRRLRKWSKAIESEERKMRKKWNELTGLGKVRRLTEVRNIIARECLTYDFWRAYDRQDYDRARDILKQTNEYCNKLGYNYPEYDAVNALLT